MVEFNKVSNESYFIKNLLYSTFLPLLRTVKENDYIIKDRMYIYKRNIIKCTNSGYMVVKNANMYRDEYPKSLLRKTDDEKVKVGQVYIEEHNGGYRKIVGTTGDQRCPIEEGWLEQNIADYYIIGEYSFGERNDKFCSNFLSSSEGYDYKTHEKLGHYLRSLRDMYDLNLMPLYNCFSNQLLRNIHITKDRIEKTSKDYQTKVYKVPIRFNEDYTIYMENLGLTSFAPAFIRHGTLLTLNNNRFGNGVDATNKYIKLNHNDVIHNEPNLRFKNPIVLRFDNIPKNKVVHYSTTVYTEIASKYNPDYYRTLTGGSMAYRKVRKDVERDENGKAIGGPWLTKDYSDPYNPEGVKNYRPGYEFIFDDGDGGSLTPAEDLLINIDPVTGEEPLILPVPDYELYESINPSTGLFEDESIYRAYRQCPDDETLFNENMYNSNRAKYYTCEDNSYLNCEENSTPYSADTTYYYIQIDKEDEYCWYELIEGELVRTEDTYIDPEKTYYKKNMTEVPITYNYDITEDNCSMYDYIEDELYLLIQVPSSYNKNIVILEGDYTNIAKNKYYDNKNFELFSRARVDRLFTDHLILAETQTEKLRPYSDTLIQYLLWHAISNLDTINNDMDRLYNDLSTATSVDYKHASNYWTDKYRETVFNYANTFPKRYIRDNLGYVTTEIERIIKLGDDYFDGDVLNENLEFMETYNQDLDEEG